MPTTSTRALRACAARTIFAEIRLHLAHRQPAQPVVAAEREHQHVGLEAAERGVDPGGAAGRRFAGDAGVHDVIIGLALLQPPVEQIHPAVLLADPVRRRQAVAVDEDGPGRRGRGGADDA